LEISLIDVFQVEKIDGCDHMVCARPGGCGHELYVDLRHILPNLGLPLVCIATLSRLSVVRIETCVLRVLDGHTDHSSLLDATYSNPFLSQSVSMFSLVVDLPFSAPHHSILLAYCSAPPRIGLACSHSSCCAHHIVLAAGPASQTTLPFGRTAVHGTIQDAPIARGPQAGSLTSRNRIHPNKRKSRADLQ
jgi:hypothetical protein